MSDRTSERCRHRKTWLIAGARIEWCYECGAWRRLRETGIASYTSDGAWATPGGAGCENPWYRFQKSDQRWQKRYGSGPQPHPIVAAIDSFAAARGLALAEAGDDEGAAAIAESGDWPMQFNSALVSLEREVEDVRPNE